MISKRLTRKWRRAVAGDAADRSPELRAEIAERDAAIKSLEEKISEQNLRIEELSAALKDSEFKAGILEQSYAKQLTQARERAEAAEQSVTDQQDAVDELEKRAKSLSSELQDAKSRLDMFGPEAGSIDEMLESFSKPKEQSGIHRADDIVDAPFDSENTDELIAPELMLAAKRKSAGD